MGGLSLAGITLEDPRGAPVPIESLVGGEDGSLWLVIQAIRYFG